MPIKIKEIEKPESDIIASLNKNTHEKDIETHLHRINNEFKDGFELVRKFPKSVTVFGSSVFKEDNPIAMKATEVTNRISKDLGYAVVTGGGPGIMEAANKGAYEAGGASVGLNVSIPRETFTNRYVNHSMKFAYFFSRKAMLMFAAEAYIFFPGGFGTMDELFNVLTLIQTGKIPKVPVILFDSHYWNSFREFVKHNMVDNYGTIDKNDLNLFEITDSPDRVVEIIRTSPVSEWWRNIN